jgi:hypothetical protein
MQRYLLLTALIILLPLSVHADQPLKSLKEWSIPLSRKVVQPTAPKKDVGYSLSAARKAEFLLSVEEGRLYSIASRPSQEFLIDIIGFGANNQPTATYASQNGACKLGAETTDRFGTSFSSIMQDVLTCQEKCCGAGPENESCNAIAMANWQDDHCILLCACDNRAPVPAATLLPTN